MPDLLLQKEVAERLQLSKGRISQLVADGRLTPDPETRRIPLSEVERFEREEILQPAGAKSGRQPRSSQARASQLAASRLGIAPGARPVGAEVVEPQSQTQQERLATGRVAVRLKRERADAERASLRLQREQGSLVDVQRMQAAVAGIHRQLRDELLTLPGRVGDVVASVVGTVTPEQRAEVRRLLEEEICVSLERLASQLRQQAALSGEASTR